MLFLFSLLFTLYSLLFSLFSFLFPHSANPSLYMLPFFCNRSMYPPLPSIKLLKQLGLGNVRMLHEQHEPTGMNAVHACCWCGDEAMLALLLEYDEPPHGLKLLDLQ